MRRGPEDRRESHPVRHLSPARLHFADCEPFSGDDTSWTPRWRDGKSLSDLAGTSVRLEVQLNSARLYAIRGDFVQMSNRQNRAFTSDGATPEPRPGL